MDGTACWENGPKSTSSQIRLGGCFRLIRPQGLTTDNRKATAKAVGETIGG